MPIVVCNGYGFSVLSVDSKQKEPLTLNVAGDSYAARLMCRTVVKTICGLKRQLRSSVRFNNEVNVIAVHAVKFSITRHRDSVATADKTHQYH